MQLVKRFFIFFAYVLLSFVVAEATSHEHEVCPQHFWNLSFDGIQDEGHAVLSIEVKNHLESNVSGRVVLSCEDILVADTGEETFHIPELDRKIAHFQISLPEPVVESDYLLLEQDKRRTCVLSVSLLPSSCEETTSEHCHKYSKECTIGIRTFIGRVLPLCGHTHLENLISNVKIFTKEGKVHVHLKTSPSEVLAFDPHCPLHQEIGYNSSSSINEYTFPLNEERSGPVTLSVEFRPNCSDHSIAARYQDVPMTRCKLGIHRYCQSGMEKIGERDIPFAQSTKYCYSPPSLRDVIATALKSHFGIDSVAVIVEIIWLICNVILYLLLMPLAFYSCILRPRLLPRLFSNRATCCPQKFHSYDVPRDEEIERILKAMTEEDDPFEGLLAKETVDEESEGGTEMRRNVVEVELHASGGSQAKL